MQAPVRQGVYNDRYCMNVDYENEEGVMKYFMVLIVGTLFLDSCGNHDITGS